LPGSAVRISVLYEVPVIVRAGNMLASGATFKFSSIKPTAASVAVDLGDDLASSDIRKP
jgi:hypothetical protein